MTTALLWRRVSHSRQCRETLSDLNFTDLVKSDCVSESEGDCGGEEGTTAPARRVHQRRRAGQGNHLHRAGLHEETLHSGTRGRRHGE